MADGFSIKILDDSGIRKIQAIHDRGFNMRPFFDRASTLIYADVIDHFKKESGPAGPWKPLAPSTKKWKAKKGFKKKLQNTGRLRQSIIPQSSSTETEVKSAEAKFGGEVYYAPIHQFGTGKIPKREFMWASRRVRDKLKKVLQDFIVEGRR